MSSMASTPIVHPMGGDGGDHGGTGPSTRALSPQLPPTTTSPSTMTTLLPPVDKWWQTLHRLILAQLVCSTLMQVSYVAFPAYNFALAMWCLVCCTPKWFGKNPRLGTLLTGALASSVVTDLIWSSLWVSGTAFYDQLCGTRGVSIISCGGATDYFPGCETNRFALVMLIGNMGLKIAACVCMWRVGALSKGHKKTTTSGAHGPSAPHLPRDPGAPVPEAVPELKQT